jgi:cellulose synthase/poly-beta-1,6-N-acetylglucosamine synthase-like glycosyltransferase
MALSALLIVVAAALLVPAAVLLFECAAASLPRRPGAPSAAAARPPLAVVVPAHDEELVIAATVRSLLPQLAPADRLLVVADNCTDRTAARARDAGAIVVERNDAARRGKGYALAHAVAYLSPQPPEVMVVVDADCALEAGSLGHLAGQAAAWRRPTQARNVVVPSGRAGSLDALAAFAFMVKNVVRPSGLARMGLPCALTGTGMALPWPAVQAAALETGALAEDLQAGIDLALAGHLPRFCPEALVTSPMPAHRAARDGQRRRWEHGHLATLLSGVPRLLRGAARQRRPALLAMALDLCVPPLSLLVLAWMAAAAAAFTLGALAGAWAPAALLAAAGLLLFLAITLAWASLGRRVLPLSTLLAAPFYVLRKVPLYASFVAGRRQREWVRTPRESRPSGHGR